MKTLWFALLAASAISLCGCGAVRSIGARLWIWEYRHQGGYEEPTSEDVE